MFGRVIIPPAVHHEVVARGIEKGRADAHMVQRLVGDKHIHVMSVVDRELLGELVRYGLKGGELESVTLYFQEEADLIASNDDKVRKLRLILDLSLISSPEIVFMMAKRAVITKDRAMDCLSELKEIGWFSSAVVDTIVEEVRKVG